MMSVRVKYVALAIMTIAVGLVIHLHGLGLAGAPRDFVGDALWGAMILWWVSAFFPQAGLLTRIGAAWLTCAGVELTQLIDWAALNAARGTLAGRLILGSGFDPRDLVAYAVGVGLAALLDATLLPRSETHRVERQ